MPTVTKIMPMINPSKTCHQIFAKHQKFLLKTNMQMFLIIIKQKGKAIAIAAMMKKTMTEF